MTSAGDLLSPAILRLRSEERIGSGKVPCFAAIVRKDAVAGGTGKLDDFEVAALVLAGVMNEGASAARYTNAPPFTDQKPDIF